MRLIAGFALLFGLAAAAALWQSEFLADLRRDRTVAAAASAGVSARTATASLPQGWGLVILGRPSGAEPAAAAVEPPADHAATPREGPPSFESPADAEGVDAWVRDRSSAVPDFELRIEPGQTLSQIALGHYGRCDDDLVEQLARYNGLASADQLQAGGAILLPDLERLDLRVE